MEYLTGVSVLRYNPSKEGYLPEKAENSAKEQMEVHKKKLKRKCLTVGSHCSSSAHA